MRASWHELEELSARLQKLHERFRAADTSNNVGQAEMFRQQIEQAERQRDALIAHISTRLISDE